VYSDISQIEAIAGLSQVNPNGPRTDPASRWAFGADGPRLDLEVAALFRLRAEAWPPATPHRPDGIGLGMAPASPYQHSGSTAHCACW
jgi:hypothetical protein